VICDVNGPPGGESVQAARKERKKPLAASITAHGRRIRSGKDRASTKFDMTSACCLSLQEWEAGATNPTSLAFAVHSKVGCISPASNPPPCASPSPLPCRHWLDGSIISSIRHLCALRAAALGCFPPFMPRADQAYCFPLCDRHEEISGPRAALFFSGSCRLQPLASSASPSLQCSTSFPRADSPCTCSQRPQLGLNLMAANQHQADHNRERFDAWQLLLPQRE